ncbi:MULTISPECIES: HPr family phosphocarrier protein [unclassified Paenibacillus]|uniref:HPr family phosphocarrier protein n=1 Tax=unclassified Paenibacillus TaxID=185978 RepID=UPI0009549547|nr:MULTISPECIES: HPr family phosphocarrier protein [unclassified Paenibacillus]ASS64740.1 HPr family phosphocarrier protein [Paenibacillus sp. RUD330]SIR08312.1 phosphocarrier protein [Paenibacillus sp. RU4X]SIR27805.1 phosphocarrier protein [Paenibacillus sp. RU4T]
MATGTFTVIHPQGFHARPSKLFVEKASSFPCKVTLHKGSKKANGKSSLGLLTLGIAAGDEITVETEGEQDEQALQELGAMLTKIYEE